MSVTDPFSAFRDPDLLKKIASELNEYDGRPLRFMEVCGTHTMSIQHYGIRNALPRAIEMVSGPGCPVCVTEQAYIDAAIELALRSDVIIATFGDLMRVPGSSRSLMECRSHGADIRVVYSPLDALKLCHTHMDKEIVFLSVGFETTVPVIALLVLKAVENAVGNLSLLTANKTMPRALEALLEEKDFGIDGFLFPGHVCSITGTAYYEDFCSQYGIPGVISGFEPLDILGSIISLVTQVREGTTRAENAYRRVVRREGNLHALDAMTRVFAPSDAKWRGIGMIPNSGLSLRGDYAKFDSRNRFDLSDHQVPEPEGCLCGDILKGRKLPTDCPLFGSACVPEAPVGACMVSSEGTCAAYYKYQ